jgi:ribulose kinase
VPVDAAAFARTIFDSLALKYRVVLEWLEELTGRTLTTIRVIGGGARNRLLNQLTADATGRVVIAGPVEATALGNLAMQLVAPDRSHRWTRRATSSSARSRRSGSSRELSTIGTGVSPLPRLYGARGQIVNPHISHDLAPSMERRCQSLKNVRIHDLTP